MAELGDEDLFELELELELDVAINELLLELCNNWELTDELVFDNTEELLELCNTCELKDELIAEELLLELERGPTTTVPELEPHCTGQPPEGGVQ